MFNSLNSNIFIKINSTNCDIPEDFQLSFQYPASPIMKGIIDFHNHLMCFIVFTVFFVTYLMFQCLVTYNEDIHPKADVFTHSTLLEIIRAIVPVLILIILVIPSFALLFSMGEMISPTQTIKIIGQVNYCSCQPLNEVSKSEDLITV